MFLFKSLVTPSFLLPPSCFGHHHFGVPCLVVSNLRLNDFMSWRSAAVPLAAPVLFWRCQKWIFHKKVSINLGTLPPIIMEVENGGLENDWLVSFRGPFCTSMVMGGRVYNPKTNSR